MKRILIVSVFFPPCERIGGKRPYNLANYLANNGWDVTVLTLKEFYTPPLGVDKIVDDRITVIRTDAFLPYVSLTNKSLVSRTNTSQKVDVSYKVKPSYLSVIKSSLITSIKKYIRLGLSKLDHIDEYSGWHNSAIKEMIKRNLDFDIVLATIPPYSASYLGVKLADYYKCKFVLDYRDPWCDLKDYEHMQTKYGRKKAINHKKIEDMCLKRANLITSVSPGISSKLVDRSSSKVLTLPQGYTGEANLSRIDKNEELYVLYAGSLAYGRDLSVILKSIHILSVEKNLDICLIYCGEHSDIALQQARSVGAESVLKTRGYLREAEAIELSTKAFCNLVIISEGYEYAYPGKLFDLITSGRPVCVYCKNENEAGLLVNNYSLGLSVINEDAAAVSSSLYKLLDYENEVSKNLTELKIENILSQLLKEFDQ